MSRFFKSAAFPILIVVVLAFFAQRLISPNDEPDPPTYPVFVQQVKAGEIKAVEVSDKHNTIKVEKRDGQKYETGFVTEYGDEIMETLVAAERGGQLEKLDVSGRKSNGWLSLLTYVLPFLIFIGFWIFLMNQVQGGGSKVMSFGKSQIGRASCRERV